MPMSVLALLVALTQTPAVVPETGEVQLTRWQTVRAGAHIETLGPVMRMAVLDGRPVRFLVHMEMEFRLH